MAIGYSRITYMASAGSLMVNLPAVREIGSKETRVSAGTVGNDGLVLVGPGEGCGILTAGFAARQTKTAAGSRDPAAVFERFEPTA
jgi:hypothetical protein